MTSHDVPPELARLWRLAEPARRGRPAKLDVDRVVNAAVAVADREGLSAATLPRVAEELGVTKMSLYRHVGSKDELIVLMADAALGPPPPARTVPAAGWRATLREWSVAMSAAYRRHDWLSQVPVLGPPSGPHHIGWFDRALGALRATGLGWGARVSVATVLSGYVRTATRIGDDLAEGRRRTGRDQAQVEAEYGRALAGLVDPERFPDAAALFGSGLFEHPAPPTGEAVDADFLAGLDLVLDGVAAAIAAVDAER